MRNEWKHQTKAATVYGLFMLALSIPSALLASEPDIVPMPADTTGVKPEHLANNCSWMDMPRAIYERCVRVAAAQMPPLDQAKREHFGEQYSPRKYLECRLANDMRDMQCERYRLRRSENPEYWPNPNVPKSKWPEAPKQQVYKPGMSGKEYFDALCKAEAGEFIYKTVENVEGIYQIRPRKQEGDYENEDRYVMEDPFGYWRADEDIKPYDTFVQPYMGKYRFLETPRSGGITQYYRDSAAHPGKTYPSAKNGRPAYIPYIVAERRLTIPETKYGYTWRGISRPHDRELGIAGGELMIVNLGSGEILALRRGFAKSGEIRNTRGGFWWMTARTCDQTKMTLDDKPVNKPDFRFIYEVLKPIANINDNVGGK